MDSDTQRTYSRFGRPEARSRFLLVRILASTEVVIVGVLVAQIATGSSMRATSATISGAVLILVTLLLVQTGRFSTARFLFPSVAWVLANLAVLTSGSASPVLLAGVNAVVTLIAAALMGPGSVPLLGSLTLLLGVALAGLDSLGPLGATAMPPSSAVQWVAGGSIYAMVALFSYFAIRQQRLAANEADRRAEQFETLTSAAAAVTASLDRDEAINRILRQLERVVPYDTAAVMLLKDDHMEIIGGRGWDDPNSVVGITFPVPADNPNTMVVETREPHILDDAPSAHSQFRDPPHDHIGSWLGVPLIMGERLIGMLTVDSAQLGRYDERHARMASAFADHVAIALENARLFEAEQRRRQLTAVQQDITQVTSSSLDLDSVLSRVARLTAAASGADRCLVYLRDQASGRFRLESGQTQSSDMPPDELDRARNLDLPPGAFGTVSNSKYHVTVLGPASKENERDVPDEWARAVDAQSMLIAPLVTHERRLGALVLLQQQVGAGFDRDQTSLVQTVAASVSASIENARLYAQMERMAITDPLTGLYNRRGLEQMGEREIEWVHRYERLLSLIMLDLDEFKQLNDAHGHTAGDEVLVEVADLLRRGLRAVDIVSRYGGEEFLVLLPESNLAAAEVAAERLRRQIEAHSFRTEAGELHITVSIGAACTEASPAKLNALIDHADQAMYAAKQAGRNQTWSWRQDGPERAAVD